MAIFLVLGAAKLHVGGLIKSPALRKDGMCSLAGALMSAGVLLSAVLEDLTDIWWADCFVAIIVALGLGAKGGHSLILAGQSGQLWWTMKFWTGASSKVAGLVDDDDGAPLLSESRL